MQTSQLHTVHAEQLSFAVTGGSGESAFRVLQRMADHVKKSFADFNEIQPPQVQYEHSVAQIDSILQQCFKRLREQRPEDAGSIENEIIRYAGERKSLEINGLSNAEDACKDQVVTVFQALSDRLVATLHPSFFQQSLQKFTARTLEPCLLDDSEQATAQVVPQSANDSDAADTELQINHPAVSNSSQNGILHDADKAVSRKRECALSGEIAPTGTMPKPSPLAMAEVAGFAASDTRWGIHQIKTGSFTSVESSKSSTQLWCWLEESKSLRYMLLSDMEWRCAEYPVDFDVQLEDVATVRASAQSWRVRLVMKEHVASGQHKPSRGDVMVVFENRETAHHFLQFCHDQDIPISEQEPPAMVTEWRNMKSVCTLTDDH
ncbi:uncharacterized protein BBA_10312 [Beauveria bassiana ARSEF 2860]|uniref:Uncharacterized protein n=1 Tax=Beauveria bassiana (strain ARSEF 2860) TaxID=655819 RepID=J5J1G9_BEAB2|nr:uncharacterized protein BBA_10312 [Beauveria bassiana ARSEF 2860]EJP60743.1 hypothetical protein BBA_10312 [Beauveria bassiana ARSEF 2860]